MEQFQLDEFQTYLPDDVEDVIKHVELKSNLFVTDSTCFELMSTCGMPQQSKETRRTKTCGMPKNSKETRRTKTCGMPLKV